MIPDALDYLAQLDLRSFIYFFWHFVLFDLTRYFLAGVAVLVAAILSPSRQRTPAFRAPVSVLLVGFNEADALRRSVTSLREQTLRELELILVDDGSLDDMRRIGQELLAEHRLDQAITSEIRGGKSSAINLGLYHCSHDLVSVVDIDTSFDRDAFERLIAEFADPRVGAVAGNLAVRNADTTLMARFQAIEYLLSISVGRRFTSMLGILAIVSGAFGVFRKSALLQVGGWDVGPGEDADITDKLRRADWHIRFAPDAWSMTDVPESLSAYTRQRLRWNRSVIRFRLRKYRAVYDPRNRSFRFRNLLSMLNILFFQVILSVSFYAYLVWLFWNFGVTGFVILGATMVLYFIATAVGYGIARALCGYRVPLAYIFYLPGYTLFSTFINRTIRMVAYLDELVFRRSYEDSYVPRKVRDATERF